MAVLAYQRLRLLWGGLDWQAGSDNPYSDAQTVSGGAAASAGAGNIGVRRAVLVIDRSTYTPAADPVQMHFDFLNMTSGAPDDTWITSDYTALEAILQTWWTTVKTFATSADKLTEIRWYRHGPGVVAPNPAERVFTLGSPVAGTGSPFQAPQVASTITFRTSVRRSWGRTYVPAYGKAVDGTSQCRLSSANVDSLATTTDTMLKSAATADFHLVVTSNALSAALQVETIEVDNVLDVQRRRRFKQASYKKLINT